MKTPELRRPADDSRAPRSRALSRAAFSLVELVITLAIIGMLAAIAIPRYGHAQARYRADAAAQRIALDLQRTRDTARTTSSPQMFILAGGTRYAFGANLVSAQAVDLSQEPYRVETAGGSLGTEDLQFDGFGNASAGTHFFVGTADEWRRIDIGSAGEVTISRATRLQAGVRTSTIVEADISEPLDSQTTQGR
jgi:prepilin-type N-terminal cleavage/methylation domain-containing protein